MSDVDEDLKAAKEHGFEAIILHHAAVTPEKVRKIQAAGLKVGAWTVNDEATDAEAGSRADLHGSSAEAVCD
ncbi:MAG: hypothetical protein WDZ51_05325 [Pirellulaceae bacterium]